MEKAILIMDIPKTCIECPCCQYEGFKRRGCGVNQRTLEDYNNSVADWCPLRPFPERVSEGDENDCFKYENILATGYNQCLEDIKRMFDNE